MRNDERYIAVKRMIQAGDITMLYQCFKIIPKTIVAEDLGEHKGRFSARLNAIKSITYEDVRRLGNLFDVETNVVFNLINNQACANDTDKTSGQI